MLLMSLFISMPLGREDGGSYWGRLQTAYSEAYRKLSKEEKEALGESRQRFNAFKKTAKGSEVFNRFNDNYWGRASTSSAADTSSRNDDTGEPPAKQTRRDSTDSISQLFDSPGDFDFVMADIQNNIPGMPSASSVAPGGSTALENPSTGGGGGRSGGAVASNEGVTKIPSLLGLKTLHLTFKKRWYKYTYGISHTKIAAKKSVARLCTPYAYYIVDWLPFYLSKQEYKSLPMASKIVSVSAKIQFLGTRTAFDHGTTLSGTATTEYIPIAKYVVGLNNKLFIENRSYKLQATEPMKVESLNEKTLDDYYSALYYPIGAMEVPRHLNWYANYLYNDNSADSINVSEFQNYRLDKVLNTCMVNKCMGTPIIDYHYEPKNCYIKPTKKAMWLDYQKEDGFAEDINNKQIFYRHNIPTMLDVSYDNTNKGTIGVANKLKPTAFNYKNRVKHNYYQSVDAYTFIHAHSGEHASFRNQPQVHVGILATPALNPGTDTTNYLNSAVYTVTDAECTVEFNMDSMCVDDDAIDWPEDVKFFIDIERGFTGYGYQNYGVTSTYKPRIESIRRPGESRNNISVRHPRDRVLKRDRILSDKIRHKFKKVSIRPDQPRGDGCDSSQGHIRGPGSESNSTGELFIDENSDYSEYEAMCE